MDTLEAVVRFEAALIKSTLTEKVVLTALLAFFDFSDLLMAPFTVLIPAVSVEQECYAEGT